MEIVVDAYGEAERAMGWHCYLDNIIRFPFKAKCNSRRVTSPLKPGQQVLVTGMAPAEECEREMFVMIRWDDEEGELAVPLSQLKPLRADVESTQAVEDWHYWVAMNYRF